MSKPRRRKQKKQVKAELKLRQFAATELSDQLAALPCAADLPRFMVDTVAGAYAPADAELMIKGFGAAVTRPVTLRANTLKATAEDIAAALDAAGIAHQTVAWYPDAFILPEAQVSDLWDLDIYRDGKIYLQSLSSMMPPLLLGAQAGEDILDMCAAAGGKAAQGAALTPLALPRLGAAHGGGRPGEHNGIPMASASYLRSLTVEDWEPYVPPRAAALYTRAAAAGLLTDGNKFEVAVLALLRAKPEADFAAVRGVSEGLEHRLAAAAREATSLDDLYTRLKTKRYPHARLRRLVLDAALGIPAELPAPPYIQVLGARKTALSRLKQAALPAGTSLADLARSGAEAAKISELHSKAVDFSALCRVKTQPMGLAFTTKPVVI